MPRCRLPIVTIFTGAGLTALLSFAVPAFAAEQVGSEDLLKERASADDHRHELTARVLRAAALTPLEAKLHALAKVLASGIDPDGRVEEALVLVAALDDLEAPHVQVLQLLTQDSPDEVPERRGFGWLIEQTVDALPGYALVMPSILSTLSGTDLDVNSARTAA